MRVAHYFFNDFDVGWMRGMLVYDNYLSPSSQLGVSDIYEKSFVMDKKGSSQNKSPKWLGADSF